LPGDDAPEIPAHEQQALPRSASREEL
jgi:hypothetical protein